VGADWTLAELVARVAQALVTANVRAPNGRVTEVPDGRVIRWYATIGLVDRPSAMRGRTALYGPRHLLQLVAVKRRQAQGRTLAEVQRELAGATDDTLRAVAAIPADGERVLAEASSEPLEPSLAPLAPPPAPRRLSPVSSVPRRFWAEPPAPTNDDTVAVLHGVRLDGATLLLPVVPDAGDLAAIHEAARPLLDLLRDRGLLTQRSVC
jgi:DNA-binding transcriptional MerR regulator